MSEAHKKVAVLGCGFAGVLMVAALKEEGFDPICFEKTDQIGGTWCYREYAIVGVGSTMPTTIANHSKEIGALSNFPPRKELNNFMPHFELYQYIKDYAAARDVMKHVRVNMEAVSCRRADDYEETGRWTVTVKNTLNGTQTTDTFDKVAVCVGEFNRPKIPSYPGMENFKGKIMHTHSLKDVSEFKGQNVVVVGMGCSGLDAAVETSTVAGQVYLSTRSGAHVFNRLGPQGYPLDYSLLRRYIVILLDILPRWLCGLVIRKLVIDPRFNYQLYAVEPDDHMFTKDPVFCENIHSKLYSGAVIQKKNIAKFTETGVVFDTEDKTTEVDTVIMATGYDWKFPFLEEGIVVQDKDTKINLFKCMWPPHLKHPTLSIVGFVLPFGPGFPVGELQCRYTALVFGGHVELPSEDVMRKDINKRHEDNIGKYPPSDRRSIRTDYVQYLDEIATQMGVKPNLWKLLFTDFVLFWKVVFGPTVSYQYRLDGPHKWEGAREAIMTVDERMHFPLFKKNKGIRINWEQSAESWWFWISNIFGFRTAVSSKKND